jgi:TatD DNase family protein
MILQRAQTAAIASIINICTDPTTLAEGIALHKRIPWIVNAAAITPHDVAMESESSFQTIAAAARSGELVAIGETGLDYHYERSPRTLQQEVLMRYLLLAEECSLPLIFHCRDAFQDLFAIAANPSRAILHCFTGSLEEALHAVERGWMISLSGIITFKKSEELRAVARALPLSHLLLETDSPYLAPQSKRGKPNEPSFLPEIAHCLAEIKNLSFEEVAQTTSENALRFLGKS